MPRVTITTFFGEDNVRPYELDGDYTIEDVKALVEVDFEVPVAQQSLFHNGRELLNEKAKIKDLGIVEDDVILVRQATPQRQAGPSAPASATPPDEVETVRNHILKNKDVLDNIRRSNQQLANSVNNPTEFRRLYLQLEAERRKVEEKERLSRLQLEIADPFDVEAQKRIEEEIRKEMVNQNYELAMEHHPESFGRVEMLYVPVEVNGRKLNAFVDSGAQATIMSTECAKKCNIMHLVDERFTSIAEGVGTAKILGRVHTAQIKIGNQFLPCSFSIMEGKMEFLFGLDMLKRHLACIDLEKDCLRINGVEIPFLSEHELKKSLAADAAEAALTGVDSQTMVDNPKVEAPPATSAIIGSSSAAVPANDPVQKLMDLGVSREQAIVILEQTNGDVDAAASLLFM